ncbi:hypothetical protein SAMN05421545_3506 [Pontibacter lucknowensis]|uniref:Uncharacterized protein n=1 Tax=Pontibacter lucknowensis TaxID=1077936 RepID=A0A1N7AQW7_9BACT|nr:hypothetical protein SAMN05421545_3506 [Pontibacter lucknowensis]
MALYFFTASVRIGYWYFKITGGLNPIFKPSVIEMQA